MQSSRKNQGSYFHKQSFASQNTRNNFINKKKLSVGSQTDNIPNFIEENLCNFELLSVKEFKEVYVKTQKFLNEIHEFMNKMLNGKNAGVEDLERDICLTFKIPEVPNYFFVYEMLLDQSRYSTHNFNTYTDLSKAYSNDETTIFNLCSKEVNIKENNINPQHNKDASFKHKQQSQVYVGDDPSFKNLDESSEETVIAGPKNQLTKEIKLASSETKSNRGPTTRTKNISPSRLVKSEKDILKGQTQELKSLSTTFENILRTCSEFENKCKETTFKKRIDLNNPMIFYNLINEKPKLFNKEKKKENLEQGDQKTLSSSSQTSKKLSNECSQIIQTSNGEALNNNNVSINNKRDDNFSEKLDLMEYSLRKMRLLRKSSPTETIQNHLETTRQSKTFLNENEPNGNIKDLEISSPPKSRDRLKRNYPGTNRSKELIDDNDAKLYSSPYNIRTKSAKSLVKLNEVSQNPKRVNEMFQKISQENLRFVDRDHNIAGYNSNGFVKTDSTYIKNGDELELSDTDSVILTDSEFERMNHFGYLAQPDEAGNRGNTNFIKIKGDNFVEGSKRKPIKSHPLNLTEKDLSQMDEKMLRSIGLFTEKGEIRPCVISMLEEQKMGCERVRNVKFRTERTFDVEVCYKKSSEELKENDSSDSISDKISDNGNTFGAAASVHSSAITFSSTISESDMVSMDVEGINMLNN